jgi:tetratricopeptide (TPR) repeat protein
MKDALAAIERAPGPTADAEGLLAIAESRIGRHAAAIERARGLLKSASSPFARWRASCRLGEVAEAAGDTNEALGAYRDALATRIESRRVPEIEERIAQLESA